VGFWGGGNGTIVVAETVGMPSKAEKVIRSY
jgi:hypothetical protein